MVWLMDSMRHRYVGTYAVAACPPIAHRGASTMRSIRRGHPFRMSVDEIGGQGRSRSPAQNRLSRREYLASRIRCTSNAYSQSAGRDKQSPVLACRLLRMVFASEGRLPQSRPRRTKEKNVENCKRPFSVIKTPLERVGHGRSCFIVHMPRSPR